MEHKLRVSFSLVSKGDLTDEELKKLQKAIRSAVKGITNVRKVEELELKKVLEFHAAGGVARAMSLTSEQRSDIARKAAKARWEKQK